MSFDKNYSARESLRFNKNEVIKIDGWEVRDVIIMTETVRWKFQPEVVGLDWITTKGIGPWMKREVYAQLEPSGEIYIVKKEPVGGITIFPDQPKKYPLSPIEG